MSVYPVESPLEWCMAFWLLPFIVAMLNPTIRKMGSGEAWFESKKSHLTPPGWVFSLVWICIYLGMGWSLFDTIENGGEEGWKLIVVNLLNWVLVMAWPWVFVNQHFKAAFAIIILLIVTLLFALYFHMRSSGEEWFSFPLAVYGVYIAWLCFAAFLSYSFM